MKAQTRRLTFRGCMCCTVPQLAAPRRRINPRRTHAGGGSPIAFAAAAPGGGPSTPPQSGSGSASASKPHRIDTHHHTAPPKFIDEMRALLQPPTIAWTIEKSLEDMDKAGVETSIT